jgi:hypothetical protein
MLKTIRVLFVISPLLASIVSMVRVMDELIFKNE